MTLPNIKRNLFSMNLLLIKITLKKNFMKNKRAQITFTSNYDQNKQK